MDFSARSNLPELLDAGDIPATDLQRNLFELEVINRKLGGHAITVKGFKELFSDEAVVRVCEIGCGGGDNLKAIEKKIIDKKTKAFLTGIDINPDCIRVTRNQTWNCDMDFLVSDYKKVSFDKKPDIIFSSLFCHHFNDMELVDMFRWMYKNSRTGFFINDLHRHPLAYHSIRFLTKLFSRSYLVKNDAPLSVLRGFKRKELEGLMSRAGIRHYSIRWHWAFRWLIIVRHDPRAL